jgi:hypothetical protein
MVTTYEIDPDELRGARTLVIEEHADNRGFSLILLDVLHGKANACSFRE